MTALELLKKIRKKLSHKTTSCTMYDFALMERKVAFAIFEEGKNGLYKKFTVTVEEFNEPKKPLMITKEIIDLYNEIFSEN
jgi:hypothetical protein